MPDGGPAPGSTSHPEAARGLVYGLAAYLSWGLIPLYFALLKGHVAPLPILAHRIVWSVAFVGLVALAAGAAGDVRRALADRRVLLTLAASAVLIAVNWLTYIYAVTTGHVMEASLGYFTNPLVNVLLGMVFLRERLRGLQAVALALATAGVAYMALGAGTFPWVALTLAVSFGFYGLVRKTVAAGPLVGLFVETALLLPAALAVIAHDHVAGARYPAFVLGRLLPSGVITAVPLLWFAAAARRLRLSTVGFLQYLAPSVQFALAVTFFGEAFTRQHAITFGLIWAALAVYSYDSLRAYRSRGPQRPGSPSSSSSTSASSASSAASASSSSASPAATTVT